MGNFRKLNFRELPRARTKKRIVGFIYTGKNILPEWIPLACALPTSAATQSTEFKLMTGLNLDAGRWYVVHSKPRKEECAKFHLELKGVEVFFPRLHLPHSVRRRKRIVPLFPNYLFVNISIAREYEYVIWSPGVKRLVGFGGSPVALEDGIVAYLKQQAVADGTIKARSNLRIGQEVRIAGGPFDGLVGIIEQPPDAKGRVRVLLNLLSREVKVGVPIQYIDSGWVVDGKGASA